ncbi:MAG: ABC transporter permease [Pseudomonadota bacterium]
MDGAPLRPGDTSTKSAGPMMALGERRFGPVNWLGLQTLYVKEVRRFLKVAFQTIFAPVISTLLFLIVFMQAFGRAGTYVNGVPYIEFLAPGLIILAILTNAFANSSSSLIIGKVQGSIVDVLMPPLSAAELTVAFVAGAATRGLLVGFVTALTSAAFMAFSDTPMGFKAPLVAGYFGLASALIFAMLGVMGGIWAEKFDQLAAITNFVITPLTFLSGTFYAIGGLPEPFLTFSKFNPVFYLIDGFRYGFTGVAEAPLYMGVLVTLLLMSGLAAGCYYLFKSGYKLKS